jgi:hypothetical protein
MEEFEMTEASNFDHELQARFPEIRAFSGKGLTDKSAALKLSISPQGIQTMLFRTGDENEFIESYSGDHKVYAVFKSERTLGKLPWSCTTEDQKLALDLNTQAGNTAITGRSGANLKTLRLAQSVTAEYSNYFGATSASQVVWYWPVSTQHLRVVMVFMKKTWHCILTLFLLLQMLFIITRQQILTMLHQ